MTTISGDKLQCCGTGSIEVKTTDRRVKLEVLVVPERPLGVDIVLGMNGITALGGISLRTPTDVEFCAAAAVAHRGHEVDAAETRRDVEFGAAATVTPQGPAVVDAADFTARFSNEQQAWTVAWKWTGGAGPECLRNEVAEYAVPSDARREYDAEIDEWIKNGWLVPYDSRVDGPPRGLVPLMAVRQVKQNKVRPVMDYRELNSFVTTHTAGADVCAEQLRKWRRHGTRVAVVDLRKAYLQLRLERRLWPYQTVMVRGQRYCLTRLGFGLNVAPQIMKAVVGAVLAEDADMQRAVLPYVDDLLVNEDIISADSVVRHFARFGLTCKQPERAADGARLLGLHVQLKDGELHWSRDNDAPPPPEIITRRAVFAWCGRLVAHLPVCGWLRPAAAWLKRRVNAVTRGWDDATTDAALLSQISQVAARLATNDPACGPWRLTGERVIVWTDASAIATGVVIESPDDGVVEDACWLRSETAVSAHINMAELDAAVRGINLAVAWGISVIDLRTDSATVHRWIDDALSGRARLRTKAHGEMLIRRRIDIIRQLVGELELTLTVALVRSEENRADALTRVPKEWLRGPEVADGVPAGVPARTRSTDTEEHDESARAASRVAAAAVQDADPDNTTGDNSTDIKSRIMAVHEKAGHPGIRRTLYFTRRDVARETSRAAVRAVVSRCDTCRSIDPAPTRWRHGSLEVTGTWTRLAMDITHYQGGSYLTLIDCGPSRYSLWYQLSRPDAAQVVGRLETVFYERGAPEEILADNDTIFRSRQMAALMSKWGTTLRFRAVHEPGGNGIVERSHRTIKVIAARRRCTIAEAVHLYNIAPRSGDSAASAPAANVYKYQVRDCVQAGLFDAAVGTQQIPPAPDDARPLHSTSTLQAGDLVWMRRRGTRCTATSRRGVVTKIISAQVVEVDGVPWHVRDLRPRYSDDASDTDTGDGGDEDDSPLYISTDPPSEDHADTTAGDPGGVQSTSTTTETEGVADGSPDRPREEVVVMPLRRSQRVRRQPDQIYGQTVPSACIP